MAFDQEDENTRFVDDVLATAPLCHYSVTLFEQDDDNTKFVDSVISTISSYLLDSKFYYYRNTNANGL